MPMYNPLKIGKSKIPLTDPKSLNFSNFSNKDLWHLWVLQGIKISRYLTAFSSGILINWRHKLELEYFDCYTIWHPNETCSTLIQSLVMFHPLETSKYTRELTRI